MITDVSGHGLGLAIVKEQVERLGGSVELDSRPRAGTTIRLIAPGDDRDVPRPAGARRRPALPAAARARRRASIAAEPSTPRRAAEGSATRASCCRARRSPTLLGLDAADAPQRAPRVRDRQRRRRSAPALLVDEVLGDREVLVKDFEPPLVRVRNVAAAGLLGGGELVLVLRPADLVAGAAERARRPAPQTPATRSPTGPPWVLVVDDAVTTRAMERGLLELAGYQVKVAVDGLDAWTTLKSERFDLVVSDVDMPRMNGFELTAADPRRRGARRTSRSCSSARSRRARTRSAGSRSAPTPTS